MDGPPMAYFEDSKGFREVYVVRAICSPNAGDLVQAYANWRQYVEDVFSKTRILVWRSRPVISFDNDEIISTLTGFTSNPEPKPHWKIYWRYALVEIDQSIEIPPIKEEGVEIPFM